jgi:hypothetical protein
MAKMKTYGKPQKRNYDGVAISFLLRETSGSRPMLTNMAENLMLRKRLVCLWLDMIKIFRLSSTFANQAFIIASLEV